MMPTCKELADGMAADRIQDLGWFDRLRHRLHAWLCPPCRHYRRQVESIGEAARKSAAASEPEAMELQAMRGRCLEKIAAVRALETSAAPSSGDGGVRGSD